MKGRLILVVLAVTGIFALCATAVQAGSGGGVTTSLNTFFECQAIIGSNVNEAVSTCAPGSMCRDSLTGLIHDNVNVGVGALLCRQVDVRSATLVPPLADGSAGFLKPLPSPLIKCYTATRPGKKASTVVAELQDAIIDESIPVTDQPTYLCAPVLINPPH